MQRARPVPRSNVSRPSARGRYSGDAWLQPRQTDSESGTALARTLFYRRLFPSTAIAEPTEIHTNELVPRLLISPRWTRRTAILRADVLRCVSREEKNTVVFRVVAGRSGNSVRYSKRRSTFALYARTTS